MSIAALYQSVQVDINDFAHLLGLDQDAISQLIFSGGMSFAEDYYPAHATLKAQTDPVYWHWYLVQWRRMDKRMFEEIPMDELRDPQKRWRMYQWYHAPAQMLYPRTGHKVEPWREIYERVVRTL